VSSATAAIAFLRVHYDFLGRPLAPAKLPVRTLRRLDESVPATVLVHRLDTHRAKLLPCLPLLGLALAVFLVSVRVFLGGNSPR